MLASQKVVSVGVRRQFAILRWQWAGRVSRSIICVRLGLVGCGSWRAHTDKHAVRDFCNQDEQRASAFTLGRNIRCGDLLPASLCTKRSLDLFPLCWLSLCFATSDAKQCIQHHSMNLCHWFDESSSTTRPKLTKADCGLIKAPAIKDYSPSLKKSNYSYNLRS